MSSEPLIFYAEDDADDRLLMQEAVEEIGLSDALVCVNDGQELLDRLREHRPGSAEEHGGPSLILLDLNMPRKDGRETLQEIKEDRSLCDIPVVVLTTSSADQDIVQAQRLGAADFFTKPTDFAALCDIVASLCTRWLQPRTFTPEAPSGSAVGSIAVNPGRRQL
jgi:CheY-like chemotaxis protein